MKLYLFGSLTVTLRTAAAVGADNQKLFSQRRFLCLLHRLFWLFWSGQTSIDQMTCPQTPRELRLCKVLPPPPFRQGSFNIRRFKRLYRPICSTFIGSGH